MNDDAWYGEGDSWDFDALEMERYDWLNNHYFHGLIKPNHHLSIERDGHRSISVWMRWTDRVPHKLIRTLVLDTSGDELALNLSSVRFNGCDATDVKDMSRGDRISIAKADAIFGLPQRLERFGPKLREHSARGALEHWRRLEIGYKRAESDFDAKNAQLVAIWRELKKMRAQGHQLPKTPYEEGASQKRVAYLGVKAEAEKLCLAADQARHAADCAK